MAQSDGSLQHARSRSLIWLLLVGILLSQGRWLVGFLDGCSFSQSIGDCPFFGYRIVFSPASYRPARIGFRETQWQVLCPAPYSNAVATALSRALNNYFVVF